SESNYIDLAVQYFVAARFACFSSFLPTSFNLFHHAFEMLFKARLLQTHTPLQLEGDFGHSLPRIWREFKKRAAEPGLNRFDGTIERLHAWETIRYPPYW